ncbi:MAG: glycosyltransferase family 4 protein [Bacteroidales bacterium]
MRPPDVIHTNPWGTFVKNRYVYIRNTFVCWQPVWKHFRRADLVIVQQSNRALINYLIQFRRIFRKKPVIAYWGHGMNFQAKSARSLPERIKAFYSNYVDYWFAYNEVSKSVLVKRGFPESRIVALQNSIDTRAEREIYDHIPEETLSRLRGDLGIGEHDAVGIYCGSLLANKRIAFLLEALVKVRDQVPGLHFIFVGDGSFKDTLRDMIRPHASWIHFVGPRFGREKLEYFKLAHFQLIPGLVGLNVIDSFLTLTPLITTDDKLHGPEVSYIVNRENGIITPNDLDAYVEAIAEVSRDREFRERLNQGCRDAREIYTIENMADNFYEGIVKALKLES